MCAPVHATPRPFAAQVRACRDGIAVSGSRPETRRRVPARPEGAARRSARAPAPTPLPTLSGHPPPPLSSWRPRARRPRATDGAVTPPPAASSWSRCTRRPARTRTRSSCGTRPLSKALSRVRGGGGGEGGGGRFFSFLFWVDPTTTPPRPPPVEIRGGARPVKATSASRRVIATSAAWGEDLTLPVLDGASELRLMLCREKRVGARVGTSVVAACGIFVSDILDAVRERREGVGGAFPGGRRAPQPPPPSPTPLPFPPPLHRSPSTSSSSSSSPALAARAASSASASRSTRTRARSSAARARRAAKGVCRCSRSCWPAASRWRPRCWRGGGAADEGARGAVGREERGRRGACDNRPARASPPLLPAGASARRVPRAHPQRGRDALPSLSRPLTRRGARARRPRAPTRRAP